MQSWKHDTEMVFVRDENYWGAKPTIKTITMRIAASGETTTTGLRAFEAGETDFAISVPSTELQRVLNDPTLSKQLTAELLSASNFLVFDTTHQPFDKTKVRQAFNLAIDRDKVVQTLSRGLYKPAKILVPPGIQGYKPSDALPGAPADAKKLLADAGFSDPKSFPQVTLTVPTREKTLAELLQQMWNETLGVNVKVDVQESKAFSAWRIARANQPFDIYTRGGWYSDYEDPTNWYNTMFADKWLNSHWDNKEFLDLVKKGAPELDSAKRQSIYEQANAILERESPTVGLYYFTDYWMRKPYLQGVQHVRIDGFIWLRDAKILAH
jgi:oligopeptide transport system substrate-binding protein